MYSFGIILDEIKMNVAAEASTCNLLSSLNTGFLFCSGPIVAGLANQFGCRVVVMGGALVTAAMYIVTAFTSSVYVMMVAYGVIGGVSTGCTYIASLIIIAEYFDKKRGIATGITMAGSGVGSFVFAPLIGMIIKKSDWRFSMSICACIILQTCVCGAFLRPLNPTGVSAAPKSKKRQVELKSLNTDANNNEKAAEAEENLHQQQRFGSQNVVQTYMGSIYSLNEAGKPKFYERNACLRITYGILKEMTDFKLLFQNFGFLLITLSNLFLFIGYFSPFLYITKIAEDNGIEKAKASFLISIIGKFCFFVTTIFSFIIQEHLF
jgi:MFS family permease